MTAYSGQVPDTEPAGQWINQAACRADGIHPDEMFPDNNETGIAHAKQICRPCPVQVDCVLNALRTGDNEHGIRGGLRPHERRNLAKVRATLPAAKVQPPRPRKVREPRPATLAEQLTGKRSFTQVGRALEEAGIG